MKTWGPCKKEDLGKMVTMHSTTTSAYPRVEKPSTCDQCIFYKMIDSGYGLCVRLPPVRQKVGFFGLEHEAKYPVIPWTNLICGEFKKKKET